MTIVECSVECTTSDHNERTQQVNGKLARRSVSTVSTPVSTSGSKYIAENETSLSLSFKNPKVENISTKSSPSSINEPTHGTATNVNVKKPKLDRRQIMVMLTLAYGNFWVAACVSLQAPFFPKEAEMKGATPTQYGLVFGIYELVICMTAPLFGKLIGHVTPNFLCEAGLFICGASTILFGVLDHVPSGTPFISLAFLIRIVEGISAAAFMTSSYTVMAMEFPDRIATTFSLLETCFGLGLILGPTVGGAFYQLGGFMLPFALLGIFLLIGSVVILMFLPESGEISEGKSGNFTKFMSDSGVLLDALAIAMSLNFIGFNAATLEPHLRVFELSPVVTGSIFVITGSIYAITTPIWGKLCDMGYDAKMICSIGCVLFCCGVSLIGPLPFFGFEKSLWLIIFSLFLIGLGVSAKLVTSFVNALHDAIHRRQFPDDMTTYGLVSAMFFTSCSVGAFVGPSLGGFLYEKIGYRNSTIFILVADLILLVLLIVYTSHSKLYTERERDEEREPLITKQRKRKMSINDL